MVRLLITVVFLLGGTCPVQLPSSLLVLNSTQRSPDSYLISCNTQVPEERVTQVHWKARHSDGTYSVIAVQNPHWGNATQLPYHEVVKLHKLDATTYAVEMTVVENVVCCEVVTYPSGKVHEKCLTIEEDLGGYKIQNAVLVTLLVGGIFVLGSFVLLFHICWMKKNSRAFKVRGTTDQQVWSRNERSHVPHRRSGPSINLAYEPPLQSESLPPMTHPRQELPRNLLPPEDPPLRNQQYRVTPPLRNQQYQVAPPLRNQHYQVAPPLRNQWFTDESSPVDPTSHIAPPLRSHVKPEIPQTPSQIYSNVNRLNKPYRKVPRLHNIQHEPTVLRPHHNEPLPYTVSDQPPSIPSDHSSSSPWLCGEASYSLQKNSALQPSRLCVPRTPEPPFSTPNPMYHSGKGWSCHLNNVQF